MATTPRLRSGPGLLIAVGLVVAGFGVSGPAPADAAELPRWTGSVELYRKGTFTTQRSWLWCTAAGVQIVRNIVDRDDDHSAASQRRYFNWMRDRNRYDLPVSAGVDPAGWTAGLRHFVDDRYRLVASRTFDEALRSAVKRIRLTNLPTAITVSHGGHGWILAGFSATADPATTSSFKVTSVRVVGPLYGLQSKNGYDMAPNTKLTPSQLKRFFTPWKYAPKRMIWDGKYVSIQPVPKTAAKPKATAAPSPKAQAVASATAAPSPMPTASPVASPSPIPSPIATADASAVAVAMPTGTPERPTAAAAPSTALAGRTEVGTGWVVVVGFLAVAIAVAAAVLVVMRRRVAPDDG